MYGRWYRPILPISWYLYGTGGCPKYGYFGGKNRAAMAGLLWGEDPTRKPFYAPYHISLHGPICIWAIFDPLWPRVGSIYGHFGGKNRAIMTGWLQGNVSAWKLFYAPYHISLYGQTWLRAIFDLSMHPYGTGEVQTMAISGSKQGSLWRAGYRITTPPGHRFVRHITPYYMAKHD